MFIINIISYFNNWIHEIFIFHIHEMRKFV